MNCPKCNAPLGANDTFCLNCGQRIEARPASPYAATNEYVSGAPAAPAAPAKKANPLDKILKGGGKTKMLIPLVAAVAVVVIALIVITSIVNSPKAIAKRYLEAEMEGNVIKAIKYELMDDDVMKKAYKDLAKDDGLSEKEYWEDRCADINEYLDDDETPADFDSYKGYLKYRTEKSMESTDEDYSEYFGSDYKIEIDIVDAEELTESKSNEYRKMLDEYIEEFEDQYETELNFDSDDAKKFMKVEYHYSIIGSEESMDTRDEDYGDGDPCEMILVKIKGDWKVLES